MHTKCPACGAVNSLDSIICNDEASTAIAAMAAINPELGNLVIRYCGLFRPAKTQLTFPRLAKLINELLPHITSQRLAFDKKLIDAPLDAWIHAFREMLDKDNLNRPISSHNYLYRIIEGYRPADANVSVVPKNTSGNNQPNSPTSAMEAGVVTLQGLKRGGR